MTPLGLLHKRIGPPRKVNTVAFSLPMKDLSAYGIVNHVCFMYTSSEDRYIKVWSMDRHKLVASVTNPPCAI